LEKKNKNPEGWAKTTLENIILKISNGTTEKQIKEKTDFPVSRIETISNATIDFDKVRYLKEPSDEVLKKYKIEKGDILFSNINSDSHLGKTALFLDDEILLHGMNLLLIRPNAEIIEPKFLNFIFNYFRKSGFFYSIAQHAVNQSSINQTKIKGIQIPLPSLNEQKKIVKKIEELFSKLDNIKMILDDVRCQINQYRESLLKSAFDGSLTKHWRKNNENSLLKKELIIKMISEVRESQKKLKFNEISPPIPKYLEHIPDSWMHVYLDSLLIDARYGTSEKCFVEKNDVCVIRIPNILSGKLDFSNLKYTNSKNNSFEKLFLVKNDILVCRTNGSLDLVGRSAIVEEIENNFAYASYLIRLRIENKILNSAYLNFLINSIVIRNFITRETRTTAGQFNVNLDMLRSIEIPVCGLGEQEEIVSKLEDGFLLIENSEKNLNILFSKLDILRSTILKSAFEGELVPQDPNDEPAEVLLQKIKQEKEQLKQKQKASRSKKNVK